MQQTYLLHPIRDGRKIAQIGQTEPTGVTRRRTEVRREVKFVRNARHKKEEIRISRISSLTFELICLLIQSSNTVSCLAWSVHFATSRYIATDTIYLSLMCVVIDLSCIVQKSGKCVIPLPIFLTYASLRVQTS